MSETRNSGCGFWVMIVMAILAISGISYRGIMSAIQSILPLPVMVSIAPQEANLPFTLQDNQIIYTYTSTLDWPCNYIIQGRILDTEGKPVSGVFINLQMLESEDVTPLNPDRINPTDREDKADPSLWELLLSNWTSSYMIWLTDKNGKSVSPTIYIDPQGCNHNTANLVFTQTRPLP